MGILLIGWDREHAEAARDLIRQGIAACGLEGYTYCEAGARAAADLDFRLALDADGRPTNPAPERRKRFYAGRTVTRSVSPGAPIPPVAGMAGGAPRSTVATVPASDGQPASASGVVGRGAPHSLGQGVAETWPPGVFEDCGHSACRDDDGRFGPCIIGDLET